MGTVHACAATGVNRGCEENELKLSFKTTNSTYFDVACRLTFTGFFFLVQVIKNLRVLYLPCTFLAYIPDCANQVPLAVLVHGGTA